MAHTVLMVPLGHPGRRLDVACTMLSAETGLGQAAGSKQWDDAGDLLVLAPGVAVSHERNLATCARLEKYGIEVITVPGSELCGAGVVRSACAARSAVIRRRFRVIYAGTSKVALSVVAWRPGAGHDRVWHVELNVSTRFHDDHTIVTISGEIDLYTAPRLHSELAAVLADGMPARVVIDMSGVEFCDSTGMNVLLSCLRRVRERGGELEIASPKPAVRKILQVTGLDAVFTLVDGTNLSQPKPAVPN